jgi:hypothetical protein
MRKWGWLLGAAVMALLLSQPEAAVNGAREAMAKWYYAVAPAIGRHSSVTPYDPQKCLRLPNACLLWTLRCNRSSILRCFPVDTSLNWHYNNCIKIQGEN